MRFDVIIRYIVASIKRGKNIYSALIANNVDTDIARCLN